MRTLPSPARRVRFQATLRLPVDVASSCCCKASRFTPAPQPRNPTHLACTAPHTHRRKTRTEHLEGSPSTLLLPAIIITSLYRHWLEALLMFECVVDDVILLSVTPLLLLVALLPSAWLPILKLRSQHAIAVSPMTPGLYLSRQ